MTKKTEVVVVGAGPVGLLAAYALASNGINVHIIEKKKQEERKLNEARGISLGPRTLEVLAAMGLKEAFIQSAQVCRSFERYLGSKKIPYDTFDFWDREQTESPYFIHMPQWKMENILADKLREVGVEIERGSEFESLEMTNNSVELQVRSGQEKEKITASYVIGCDGVLSPVRKAIGVETEIHTEAEFGHYQIDAKLTPFPFDKTHRFFFFLKGISFAMVPLFDDYLRMIVWYRFEDPRFQDLRPEIFSEVLSMAGFKNIQIHDPIWISDYRPKSALAKSLFVNRVFIAGDAAHPVSPVSAQGINTGFQDSYNLCWKLILALRNQGSLKLFTSYHEERHQAGQQLMEHAHNMTKLIKSLNEGGRQGVLLRLKFRSNKFMFNYLKTQSQLMVKYENSAILQAKESVDKTLSRVIRPGERFPNFHVCTSSIKLPLYNYTTYTKHLLLIFSGGCDFHGIKELLGVKSDVEARFYDVCKCLCVSNGTLSPSSFDSNKPWPEYVVLDTEGIHYELKIEKPCAILLRPDNHIACIYPLENKTDLLSFLGGYLT